MASSRFRKSTLGDIVTIIVGSIIFALVAVYAIVGPSCLVKGVGNT